MIRLLTVLDAWESDAFFYRHNDRRYETHHPAIAMGRFRRGKSDPETSVSVEVFEREQPAEDTGNQQKFRRELERAGLSRVNHHVVNAEKPTGVIRALREAFQDFDPSDRWVLVFSDSNFQFQVMLLLAERFRNSHPGAPTEIYTAVRNAAEGGYDLRDTTWMRKVPDVADGLSDFLDRSEGRDLADHIGRIHDETYKNSEDHKSRKLQGLASLVRRFGEFLNAGLSQEAGLAGSEPDEAFWEEVRSDFQHHAPYLTESVSDLRKKFQRISVPGNNGGKTDVVLDEDELNRQIEVGRCLLEKDRVQPVYLLARELLVNAAILGDREAVVGSEWLDGEVRDQFSAKYYKLNHWMVREDLRSLLSDFQQFAARTWAALKQRRNAFAHAGMMTETLRWDRIRSNAKELWEDVVQLVTRYRTKLEDLLSFPFSDVSLLYPVGEGQNVAFPECLEEYRPTKVFLLVPDHFEWKSRFLEWIREYGGEREPVLLRVGSPEAARRNWKKQWQSIRKNILQSRRIVAFAGNGTGEMSFVLHRILGFLRHYGIPWVETVCREPAEEEQDESGGPELVEVQTSAPEYFDDSGR